MKTKLVYRVELTDGSGPYNPKRKTLKQKETWWRNHSIVDHSTRNRPNPYRCNVLCELRDISKYHFAFSSITQLKKWFPKSDRHLLDSNNYKCAVYEVPRDYFVRATNQCVFRKCKSKLIKKLNLNCI